MNGYTLMTLTTAAGLGLAVPVPTAAQLVADTTGTVAEHEFVVSGFVGPTFGADVDEVDAGVGGAFTYLHRGMIGGEVIANVTPDLDFASDLVDGGNVNSVMFNGVAALPLGEEGRWQPFVSGGLGTMTLNAEFDDLTDVFEVDDTQLAGNIGFGVMGFTDRWGFRTGMRYVAGLSDDPVPGDVDAPSDLVDPEDALGDVAFWRADVGVAYRW